jgi:hypothetical protein
VCVRVCVSKLGMLRQVYPGGRQRREASHADRQAPAMRLTRLVSTRPGAGSEAGCKAGRWSGCEHQMVSGEERKQSKESKLE